MSIPNGKCTVMSDTYVFFHCGFSCNQKSLGVRGEFRSASDPKSAQFRSVSNPKGSCGVHTEVTSLERASFFVECQQQKKSRTEESPLIAENPTICDDIEMARGQVVWTLGFSWSRGQCTPASPPIKFRRSFCYFCLFDFPPKKRSKQGENRSVWSGKVRIDRSRREESIAPHFSGPKTLKNIKQIGKAVVFLFLSEFTEKIQKNI